MSDHGGTQDIVLMVDPRVTAIPVHDNGEELVDVRDHGLRVSSFRADDTGIFAYIRAGLAGRPRRASEALRAGGLVNYPPNGGTGPTAIGTGRWPPAHRRRSTVPAS